MKEIRFDKIAQVVEKWIAFTESGNPRDTSKRTEWIRRMFEREPVDWIIEFYWVPKLYKWEYDWTGQWKQNPRLSNVFLDVEMIKPEHLKVIDDYLVETWVNSYPWEFIESYNRKEDIRKVQRAEAEIQRIEDERIKKEQEAKEKEAKEFEQNMMKQWFEMFKTFITNFAQNGQTINPSINNTPESGSIGKENGISDPTPEPKRRIWKSGNRYK